MNMFRILAAILCVASLQSFATVPGQWLLDLDANVTLTQNAYTSSWIGDEKGSVAWASKLNFVAARQFTSKFYHRNTLKLAFGQTKTQSDLGNWGAFTKSADLIDFESLQRFTINGWVEPFIAVRLISQFVDGRHLTHKHYVNPLNISESFGASRTFLTEPNNNLNARLGGAINQVVTRHFIDTTKADATSETKVINSAGLEAVSEYKGTLKDGLLDVSLLLTVFEALVSSEKEKTKGTTRADYWRYPDINLEGIFSVNLTKYIMVNLTAQLLYDKELADEARIKEVLALGLTYKFNNAKKPAAK